MNGNLSFIGGVTMGWDTTGQEKPNGLSYADTNSLTFEGGAAWNPSKVFSWTLQGYTGQVEEGSAVATPGLYVVSLARPNRSLIDTVITYHMTSALTLTLNGDAGQQTNSNIFNNIVAPRLSATAPEPGAASPAMPTTR